MEFLSIVDEGEGGDDEHRPAIMLIKRKAELDGGDTLELRLPIAKLDKSQHTVFGLASIITDNQGRPIVDHGDDVILASDLEKAVHSASLIGGAGKAGDMHLFKGVADLVESAVITSEKRQASRGFLGDSLAEGWWVGLKIRDESVWNEILKGRRPELSIKIRAKRTKVDDLSTIERFKRFLGIAKERDSKTGDCRDDTKKGVPMPTLDQILASLPEETRNAILAHIAQIQKPAAPPVAPVAPVAPEMKAEPMPQPPTEEETQKALAKLPEGIREKIEKSIDERKSLEKANADLAKRVAKMEDDVELASCIEKARKEFPYLPMATDELGAMYKSAKSSMGEKEFAAWERLMKANNEAMAKGGLWSELGSGGAGVDDPASAELDAAIEKVRAKDPTITHAQAKLAVFNADPKLYERVRASEQ